MRRWIVGALAALCGVVVVVGIIEWRINATIDMFPRNSHEIVRVTSASALWNFKHIMIFNDGEDINPKLFTEFQPPPILFIYNYICWDKIRLPRMDNVSWVVECYLVKLEIIGEGVRKYYGEVPKLYVSGGRLTGIPLDCMTPENTAPLMFTKIDFPWREGQVSTQLPLGSYGRQSITSVREINSSKEPANTSYSYYSLDECPFSLLFGSDCRTPLLAQIGLIVIFGLVTYGLIGFGATIGVLPEDRVTLFYSRIFIASGAFLWLFGHGWLLYRGLYGE